MLKYSKKLKNCQNFVSLTAGSFSEISSAYKSMDSRFDARNHYYRISFRPARKNWFSSSARKTKRDTLSGCSIKASRSNTRRYTAHLDAPPTQTISPPSSPFGISPGRMHTHAAAHNLRLLSISRYRRDASPRGAPVYGNFRGSRIHLNS